MTPRGDLRYEVLAAKTKTLSAAGKREPPYPNRVSRPMAPSQTNITGGAATRWYGKIGDCWTRPRRGDRVRRRRLLRRTAENHIYGYPRQ